MRKGQFYFLLFVGFASSLEYPGVYRDLSVVDDYHGTLVGDPYRWLENASSPETDNFAKVQQNLTAQFLSTIPERETIEKRLYDVWNFPKFFAPKKAGGRYFTRENSGLQNQPVMYVQDGLEGERRVLLDPNELSENGTIALSYYAFSFDGVLFAYTLAESGSDWEVMHFKNISSGFDFPEKLFHVKWPSLTFSKDGKGVFYARFPAPELRADADGNHKIYYHLVGTEQENDILIAEYPESPQRILRIDVSDRGNYIIVAGNKEFTANTVHMASIHDGINEETKNKLTVIFPSETEAEYRYITNIGNTFFFRTNKDAPNYKLVTVEIDLENATRDFETGTEEQTKEKIRGERYTLTTFLEEDPKNVLAWAEGVDTNKLVVAYLEDVKTTLQLRSLDDGSLIHKFELPAGTIYELQTEDNEDTEFFFELTNFLSPGTIYRCAFNDSIDCQVFKESEVDNPDLDTFLTEQVFYPSKDGTIIPMYIVRKKDLALDGTAPTLLYGYGGFSVLELPYYQPEKLVFAEGFNGIYASANIRGGGEYGEAWHLGGILLNKQNSYDDFAAAAEYLIHNNYTSSSKLTIIGASNGGLMVGATVNQRPELFGAAIAQVGVMDMLRFQKFTVGYVWCVEYGCSEEKVHFENLIKYSPLHNIRLPTNESVQYPAIFMTTADHDDRVVPSHSYKYAAEIQYTIGKSSRQTNSLLLRVYTDAGHGAGKPTAKTIEEWADIYAFMGKTLALEFAVV